MVDKNYIILMVIFYDETIPDESRRVLSDIDMKL